MDAAGALAIAAEFARQVGIDVTSFDGPCFFRDRGENGKWAVPYRTGRFAGYTLYVDPVTRSVEPCEYTRHDFDIPEVCRR